MPKRITRLRSISLSALVPLLAGGCGPGLWCGAILGTDSFENQCGGDLHDDCPPGSGGASTTSTGSGGSAGAGGMGGGFATSSGSTDGAGGANVCEPGSTAECYSAEPATKNVGA